MQRKNPSVLISGASVAGPALADRLIHQGFDVTVVERAAALRTGGQNVDLEGEGRLVADRIGITTQIREATTGETGTEFVDSNGETVGLFPAADDASFTAELEVPRGKLSRILYDRSKAKARYVFDEQIAALEDRGHEVAVSFASGKEETYDLVVVAEGLRSHTRKLLFDDVDFHHLGLYIAWFPIARTAEDTDNWRIFHAPGGRAVSIRPATSEIMRAMLALRSAPAGYEKLSRDEQVAMLRDRYVDAGWESQRVLDGLSTEDVEFQPVAQVRAPTWSKNRVVLLGDAAYAPSPLTGQGTSLALVGAYLLAGELAQGGDVSSSLQRYELLMRPRVDAAQKLPPASARLALPDTGLGVGALRSLVRVASSGPFRTLRGLFPEGSAEVTSQLPPYGEAATA